MYAVSNHLDMETSISKRLVMTPHFPDNTMSETNHLGTIKKVKLKEEAIATQCVKSCLSVSEVALWPRWPLIERHSSAKCQQTLSYHHHDLIFGRSTRRKSDHTKIMFFLSDPLFPPEKVDCLLERISGILERMVSWPFASFLQSLHFCSWSKMWLNLSFSLILSWNTL